MALREITHYALGVAYAPEDVIRTLVDFSDRRPLIWRETSHPEVYRLHSLTATGADVTEGVPVSWSREQYDWSEPGFVRLRQIDSNTARPGGTITYRITPTPGGCHIECDRGRTFIGLRGHLLGWLMARPTGVERAGTHSRITLIPIEGADSWEAAAGSSA